MEWDASLIAAFRNEADTRVGASAKRGLYLVIKAQRPQFYLKIIWELFTTFVIYAPGTGLLRTVLIGVSQKWPSWNELQRSDVIAFLRRLDRKGEVSKEMEG